jgi:hypothetical protein
VHRIDPDTCREGEEHRVNVFMESLSQLVALGCGLFYGPVAQSRAMRGCRTSSEDANFFQEGQYKPPFTNLEARTSGM